MLLSGKMPHAFQSVQQMRLGHRLISVMLISELIGLGLTAPDPAHAQNSVGASASAPSTACVAGAEKNGEAKGRQFTIQISQDKLDKYLARGFVVADCRGAVSHSAAQRRRVCDYAASGNRAVKLLFLQRYGMTPAEFCNDLPENPRN